ncbi:MAG: hypothetical protein H0U73_05600 [Tatlockia sp.]|nr:hypothetical protein [Tatlockia sp.]
MSRRKLEQIADEIIETMVPVRPTQGDFRFFLSLEDRRRVESIEAGLTRTISPNLRPENGEGEEENFTSSSNMNNAQLLIEAIRPGSRESSQTALKLIEELSNDQLNMPHEMDLNMAFTSCSLDDDVNHNPPVSG